MKFTDEDLERLKDEFEPYSPGDPRILTGSDWEGLIARLEAAELLSRAWAHDHPYDLSVKAWRKAAGEMTVDCEKCGGEMRNQCAGDEIYKRCRDCGHVDFR